MNRSIRGVALVAGLMFLALLINATVSYLARSEFLLNYPSNNRVRDEQFGSPRGPILVGNTPVVQNVPTNNEEIGRASCRERV